MFGWFTLDLSLAAARGWTWPQARIDLMHACVAAADGAVDFGAFQGIVAVLNAPIDSGSSGRRVLEVDGGKREFGLVNLDPGAWNNTFTAHEMGHGYGLPHSFSDEPTVSVYGDGWDIMSAMTFGGKSPTFTHHVFGPSGPALCGVYQDRLGWIPSGVRLDLSSFGRGATLTINALDKAPPGIRLIRIWLGFSTQHYAVCACPRRPAGTRASTGPVCSYGAYRMGCRIYGSRRAACRTCSRATPSSTRTRTSWSACSGSTPRNGPPRCTSVRDRRPPSSPVPG